LRGEAGLPPAILWRGHEVARLTGGKNLLSPRVHLDRRIDRVPERGREAVIQRLKAWVGVRLKERCAPLRRAGMAARAPDASPSLRAVLAMLVDDGGIVAREGGGRAAGGACSASAAAAAPGSACGSRARPVHAGRAEAEAMRWRAALSRGGGEPMQCCGPAGAVVTAAPARSDGDARIGLPRGGPAAHCFRVDMAERIAVHAHEVRTPRRIAGSTRRW
jgi:ATP-dependent RNA helicase SUPV3L1/SUV3